MPAKVFRRRPKRSRGKQRKLAATERLPAMPSNTRFTEVASLAGDPARAGMLHALMDGRALTATELSRVAGITPQTASGHLARLVSGGLVQVTAQGRHRYHKLASPAVAQMIESIMQIAPGLPQTRNAPVTGPRDAALRRARTCYDHLAGQLGVALADALIAGGCIELSDDAGVVTEAGVALFARIGMDRVALTGGRSARILCQPCLDWSERRPHLAGAIGSALCALSFSQGWIRRMAGTRAVTLTPAGRHVYCHTIGVRLAL